MDDSEISFGAFRNQASISAQLACQAAGGTPEDQRVCLIEIQRMHDSFEQFVSESKEKGLIVDLKVQASWMPFYVCFRAGWLRMRESVREQLQQKKPLTDRLHPSLN